MIPEARLSIALADFIIKYLPLKYIWVVIGDRKRFKDISLERISVDDMQYVITNDNDSTAAFRNHVIRDYSKISRKNIKGGKKAKIKAPRTYEENLFLDFHIDEVYRLGYSGSFFRADETGNYIKIKTESLDKEIMKRIQNRPTGTANRVIYLKGNIGCGKSTLLSTIVTKIVIKEHLKEIQRSKKSVLNNDICIVSFEDFKVIDDNITAENFIKKAREKIALEIEEQVNLESEGNLKNILKNCAKKSNFTLILDGLDFIYVYFCKYCFDLHDNMGLYYKILFDIIGDFVKGDLSDLNINVIIAFRNETLGVLKNTNLELSGVHRINIPESDIFDLLFVPEESIDTVFDKRIEYVKDNSDRVENITRKFSFKEYNGIAVHGLRHIVDTWAKSFSHLNINHTQVRLYDNEKLFRLFFLSSGLKNYSQVNHGITNIFLVNPNYRADRGDITLEESLEIDEPSLWLKYFMLAYLCENKADKSSVIRFFSENSNFHPKLIKIILLGFSEIEHGRIIKPIMGRFDGNDAISTGITLTSRGRTSIQSGLFFSFEYLSCIVEDIYLRMPSNILHKFDKSKGIDFILEKEKSNYEDKLYEYLCEKSSSVISFIVALEAAYKVEKSQNKSLFRKLESDKYKKYRPNFTKMRDDSISSIEILAKDLSDDRKNKIISIISENLKSKNRILIERSIYSTFNREHVAQARP